MVEKLTGSSTRPPFEAVASNAPPWVVKHLIEGIVTRIPEKLVRGSAFVASIFVLPLRSDSTSKTPGFPPQSLTATQLPVVSRTSTFETRTLIRAKTGYG